MAVVTVSTRVSSETATSDMLVFPITGATIPGVANVTNSGSAIGTGVSATYSSGQGGFPALVVQKTTGAALGADGQWVAAQVDPQGNLRVIPGSAVLDTATSSMRVSIVAGAGSGGTSATDSAAFTVGSGSMTPIGGIQNDSVIPIAAGVAAVPRITPYRGLHTNLRSNTGTEVGITATGLLRVSVDAGGGTGGTSAVDGAAFTAGASSFTPMGGRYDAGSPSGVTTGTMDTAAITAHRAIKVALFNQSGSTVYVTQPNPVYTDPAVQVSLSGVITDNSGAGGFGNYYGFNQFGVYNDSVQGQLITGQSGGFRSTSMRAMHVNLRDNLGTDVTDSAQHAVRTTQYSTSGTAVSIASNGSLNVTVVGGGGTGGTASTDSTVFTAGSTSVTPIAAYFTDTAAPIGAPQLGGLRMSKWRSLWTTPVTESGVYMTDTVNSAARVSLVTMAQVIGAVASGSTDAQAPVKTGGFASSVQPTTVVNGQVANTWTDLAGRTHIIANVSSVFGSLTQPITCTLANLNAGTAVSRSSAAIDNTVNNFLDALVTININGGRPGGNAQAMLWAYGSVNGGTNYSEGNTGIGTDAAYAMNNPTALRYLGAVPMPFNSQVYTGGPFSVAAAFDGMLPPRWGIVVQNDGAFPFMPTNSSAIYVGVARQMI